MKNTLIFATAILLIALAPVFVLAQNSQDLFQKALVQERAEGDLEEAITIYRQVVSEAGNDRALAARALVQIGQCYEKLGNTEAQKAYEQVVSEYADQAEQLNIARARLEALNGEATVSRAEVASRRIWVAGSDRPVSISPDGSYVVFIESLSGNLWLRDLESGERRQITRDGSMVEWAFAQSAALISPNNELIAYRWWIRSSGETRLSALDGSSLRIISRDGEGDLRLQAWMPDSKAILAVSYDGNAKTFQRHIISVPEGTKRDIGQPDRRPLAWVQASPDGRYIAYNLNLNEGLGRPKRDILIHDATTGKDWVVVPNAADDFALGWTPNGSGILFVSDRSGPRDLYQLDLEAGQPQGRPLLLRRDLGTRGPLFLSRDGHLYYAESLRQRESFITALDEDSGKPVGQPSLVDREYPGASSPDWSSDGELRYYIVNKGPAGDRSRVLVIRSEETGEMREIFPTPRMQGWSEPRLSPDGQWFAISGGDGNGNYGVFKMDSKSGEVSLVAKVPTEITPVLPAQNWSPDGKAIYYKVRSPEDTETFIIRRKDLTTGEEEEIYRGFHTRYMRLSPDGTRMVYYRNDRPTNSYVFGTLDLSSGEELELWRVQEAESPDLASPMWTPDGKSVIVHKLLQQGVEVWRFPASGGPGELLHSFPEGGYVTGIHPSAERMAYVEISSSNELWGLENFLPESQDNE